MPAPCKPLPAAPALRAALACAALAGLLGACAVATPPALPEAAAAPAAFKEAGDASTLWQRAASGTSVPEAWWTVFGDARLDALQQRLAAGNLSLRSLAAQVASARAVLAASREALLPSLSVSANASRTGSPSSGTAAATVNPVNSISLLANASWELDLWGRLSQATSAAQASLQASADDLAAARLSAHAALAQTYLALCSADAQLDLLARSVQAFERSLALTRARHDAGVVSGSDVAQAESQLLGARAQQADAQAQRAVLEHAIAVLIGEAPSTFSLAAQLALPAMPALPPMLPATLLERRPDIAAARQRVRSAYAQLGIAQAAYFPQLALSASAGFRKSSLADLVSAPNLLWSLGAALSQAVLDGGQRQLASAQARAAAEQATASYRQIVLTALQEVEDNLVLADRLQRESELQAQALAASRRNLEITLAQYRAGTVSYLNVVVAQAAVLDGEGTQLTLRNRQLAAVNQLLKNIAGRWQPA